MDVSPGLLAASRRAVSSKLGLRACAHCWFPLKWSGCEGLAAGCRVHDPSEMLLWLGGPSPAVLDRLALEAVSARAVLLGDVALGPPFPPSRRGRVAVLSEGAEVRIVLVGPAASAVPFAYLRSVWNVGPDQNRAWLRDRLDRGVRKALSVATPVPDAVFEDGDEDSDDDYDLGLLLVDLEGERWDEALAALIVRPWLCAELASARPDLLRKTGQRLADAWYELLVEPGDFALEQLLTALSVLSAGAAAGGAVQDAEELLAQGWTVLYEFQTQQATSDFWIVGPLIAPLLQAWSVVDLGAFAFLTLLASGGWTITDQQTNAAVDAVELVCRPLVAGPQLHSR